MDLAAQRLTAGAFGYAGQSCISVQRVYIHRAVYAELRERLVKRAQGLKIGDPAEEATDVGPMITDQAANRAIQWIDEARDKGATIAAGGTRDGGFVWPTILENVPQECAIYKEEAFAPVMVLEPYDDAERALQQANASRFGLQAGVFTRDLELALRAFEVLEVGAVLVNEVSSWRIDPMPYGGVKESGFGREGLRAAIEEMTEPRLLVIKGPR